MGGEKARAVLWSKEALPALYFMNTLLYVNGARLNEARPSQSEVVPPSATSLPVQAPSDTPNSAREPDAMPARPVALRVRFENIPAQLCALNGWVLWRYEWNGNNHTKVPYQPNGHRASINKSATWSSLRDVRAAYEAGGIDGAHGFDGIGLVLARADGIVGVDLDHQMDGEGKWSALALEALGGFASYAEVSPGGGGLRIFVRGTLGRAGHKKEGVEIYGAARYLTVTGHRIVGTSRAVEGAQGAIDAFVERHFAKGGASGGGASGGGSAQAAMPLVKLSAKQLLRRARAARNGSKFRALYDAGDISAYGGDDSAADLALCRMLAFWSGPDAASIDALLRGSALWRGPGRAAKWDAVRSGDGRTYGQLTIGKALESCTRFYDALGRRGTPWPSGGVPSSDAGECNTKGGESSDIQSSDAQEVPCPDIPITPGFALDDIGNGKRFAAQHRARARYCPSWKCWMVYNTLEGRWVRDQSRTVEALAKGTANSIAREALATPGDAERAALLGHARRATARTKREVMVKDAQSEDGMILLPHDLDSAPWQLNVLNGTLDLRTGRLLPHDPDDLLGQLAPVVFDPAATCPLFEAFLRGVFNESEEMIEFVAQVLGYTLTGQTREQMFFPVVGRGSNGKSTLLQTVRRLLGTYAREFDPQTFMVRQNERIAVDVADLHNVRMAITSESSATQRLDEGKIKRMTGGEDLIGERKFEHPFSFSPQFKLFLVTNHLPQIKGTDRGIWRRVAPLPFEEHFWKEGEGREGEGKEGEAPGPPNRRADLQLPDKLHAEFPGILNWLVGGCLRWQRAGALVLPKQVLAKKGAYREEQDELGEFIADCCRLDPGAQTRSRELYGTYESWCIENARAPLSENLFGARLLERGLTSGKTRKYRTRVGIALQDKSTFAWGQGRVGHRSQFSGRV